MKKQDELSDGEFWDIGDDSRVPHRRKQIARGNTSFPSLSVYISCQEEAAKDDSGNTVSISIPDIANVSELRIDQIGSDDKDKKKKLKVRYDHNDDKKVTIKAKNDEEKTNDPKEEDPLNEEDNEDQEDFRGELSKNHSEDEEDVGDEEEDRVDDDFGDILYFDNSEPKTVGVHDRRPSLKNLIKHSFSKQSSKILGSRDAEKFLVGSNVPPHQLLKHWLYRGRKLLSTGDGQMAVDAFVRSYALARIVHGTSHWRTARCKVFLARSYFYLLNYSPQAMTHITEANDVITSCLSSSVDVIKKPQIHHTLAWSHLIEGEAKISLKMYRQAFPSLSRSLYHTKQFTSLISRRKRLKASMKMDNPVDLTLNILCAQARLYEATNNYYKARSKLEESLQLANSAKNLEQKEMKIAAILKTLGNFVLRFAGKTREGRFNDEDLDRELEEGLDFLKTALKMVQKHKRPGSAKECELRFLIAKHNLKHDLDKYKSIWWELHKLKIWSVRIHGHASINTKEIQDCLIQVLIKEGNYDEALKELNEMLIATQSCLGECNIQVCNILRQMVNVSVMKRSLGNALMALEQCLSLEILLFGSQSRRVQGLKLKIKDLLFEVPAEIRKKILKKHPELQHKPPFRPYC